jgi:hypothetical protein
LLIGAVGRGGSAHPVELSRESFVVGRMID